MWWFLLIAVPSTWQPLWKHLCRLSWSASTGKDQFFIVCSWIPWDLNASALYIPCPIASGCKWFSAVSIHGTGDFSHNPAIHLNFLSRLPSHTESNWSLKMTWNRGDKCPDARDKMSCTTCVMVMGVSIVSISTVCIFFIPFVNLVPACISIARI